MQCGRSPIVECIHITLSVQNRFQFSGISEPDGRTHNDGQSSKPVSNRASSWRSRTISATTGAGAENFFFFGICTAISLPVLVFFSKVGHESRRFFTIICHLNQFYPRRLAYPNATLIVRRIKRDQLPTRQKVNL